MQSYKNIIKPFFCRNQQFFPYAKSFISSKQRNEKYIRIKLSQLIRAEKTGIIRQFKDVTPAKIVELNEILVENKYSRNYINYIHSAILEVVNHALSKGMLHSNPYKGLKLKQGEKGKGIPYISTKTLRAIENMTFSRPCIQFAADLFIFCCHTGLAYTDLVSVLYENISTISGQKWLTETRNKTNIAYYVPLNKKAMQIIKKYKRTERKKISDQHVFPFILLTYYNQLLKKAAKEAKITDVELSSHVARHTFATCMLEKGVSIESIKKMLGHSMKSEVTWLYAQVTTEKISRELKKM